MEKFYQEHKSDTRFAFIEFPIKGPDSIVAAKVALAARHQPDKYLALHFALMSETQPVDANMIYAGCAESGAGHGQAQDRHGEAGDQCRD